MACRPGCAARRGTTRVTSQDHQRPGTGPGYCPYSTVPLEQDQPDPWPRSAPSVFPEGSRKSGSNPRRWHALAVLKTAAKNAVELPDEASDQRWPRTLLGGTIGHGWWQYSHPAGSGPPASCSLCPPPGRRIGLMRQRHAPSRSRRRPGRCEAGSASPRPPRLVVKLSSNCCGTLSTLCSVNLRPHLRAGSTWPRSCGPTPPGRAVSPAAPACPARPPRLRARERERVKEAAEFCADVLADGWMSRPCGSATELELSGFSQEVCGRRVVVTVAAGGAIAVL